MVDILKHAGRTNLDGAYSTLGRLLTWATIKHPGAVIDSETVREWLQSIHVTQATMTSVTWLRDWTGCDLPARSVCVREFQRGTTAASSTIPNHSCSSS